MADYIAPKVYVTRRLDKRPPKMLDLDQVAALRAYEGDRLWLRRYDLAMARLAASGQREPYESRVGLAGTAAARVALPTEQRESYEFRVGPYLR